MRPQTASPNGLGDGKFALHWQFARSYGQYHGYVRVKNFARSTTEFTAYSKQCFAGLMPRNLPYFVVFKLVTVHSFQPGWLIAEQTQGICLDPVDEKGLYPRIQTSTKSKNDSLHFSFFLRLTPFSIDLFLGWPIVADELLFVLVAENGTKHIFSWVAKLVPKGSALRAQIIPEMSQECNCTNYRQLLSLYWPWCTENKPESS